MDLATCRTMALATLVMSQLFHVFECRSERHSIFEIKLLTNPYLVGAVTVSIAMLCAILYVPFLAEAFGFEHISILEYFVSMGLAVAVIPIVEIVKLIQRKVKK